MGAGVGVVAVASTNGSLTEVYINGTKAPSVDLRSLNTDITSLLTPGENTVKIVVSSTLANRMLERGYDLDDGGGWGEFPATRPSQVDYPTIRDYGLTGGVSVVPYTVAPVVNEPTPVPTVTVTVKPSASTSPKGDLYETPGLHQSGGRRWLTTCEAYSSQVDRRWTWIWGPSVEQSWAMFVATNGWVFNNQVRFR